MYPQTVAYLCCLVSLIRRELVFHREIVISYEKYYLYITYSHYRCLEWIRVTISYCFMHIRCNHCLSVLGEFHFHIFAWLMATLCRQHPSLCYINLMLVYYIMSFIFLAIPCSLVAVELCTLSCKLVIFAFPRGYVVLKNRKILPKTNVCSAKRKVKSFKFLPHNSQSSWIPSLCLI